MTTLMDYSKQQNVAFGTSGVRALVSDLTLSICYAYANAFLSKVCPEAKELALGIDLRPSSNSIATAIATAARDRNIEVKYCGALPTPALAYFALQHKIPAVMVTGSHIPFDRNGFKFYTPQGEITKDHESLILSSSIPTANMVAGRELDPLVFMPDAVELFKQRYVMFFSKCSLTGKRVGVYEHSSVARDLIKDLLSFLGAEVISLERTDTFVPIDTEAVSAEDQRKAYHWSKEFNLDCIVSTDGDGDRPLISDEHGTWLRGDVVGIIVAQYLGATHVSCPVNSNTALEQSLPSAVTERTRIGSPYVISGMEQLAEVGSGSVVGYEANGGFLVGNDIHIKNTTLSALPTRDSILPILATLAASVERQQPISALVASLPQRFTYSDRIKEVPTSFSRELIKKLKFDTVTLSDFLSESVGEERCSVARIDETDGLRLILDNGDVVHLRPSGNAPELRCYAESSSDTIAKLMVKDALAYITKLCPQ